VTLPAVDLPGTIILFLTATEDQLRVMGSLCTRIARTFDAR
jgi:hypothetical protein